MVESTGRRNAMAIFHATLAAVSFGALALLVRRGLRIAPELALPALAQNGVAFALSAGLAVALSQAHGNPAPFLLIGLLVPEFTRLTVRAIARTGSSRATVVANTSPLPSFLVAVLVLGEPFRPPLPAGPLLIVGESVVLALERDRPDHVRTIGLVLAVVIAGCFAARDTCSAT